VLSKMLLELTGALTRKASSFHQFTSMAGLCGVPTGMRLQGPGLDELLQKIKCYYSFLARQYINVQLAALNK
jgi:hypothetical protein